MGNLKNHQGRTNKGKEMATTLKQNKLWTTKYNFALLATEVDRLILVQCVLIKFND